MEPRGVQVLLRILTRFLNDTLVEDGRRCHPGFTHTDRQDQAGEPPTDCLALRVVTE